MSTGKDYIATLRKRKQRDVRTAEESERNNLYRKDQLKYADTMYGQRRRRSINLTLTLS